MDDLFVKVECPDCQKRLKIPNKKLHKKIVCPNCKCVFRSSASSFDPTLPIESDEIRAESTPSEQVVIDAELVAESDSQARNQSYWAGPQTGPTTKETNKIAVEPDEYQLAREENCKTIGLYIVAISTIVSFLSLFGLRLRRFRLRNIIRTEHADSPAPFATALLGFIGIALFYYGMRRNKEERLSMTIGLMVIVIGMTFVSYVTKHYNPFSQENKLHTSIVRTIDE